ncbi:4-carboxymuconolactone decarboxylase, putative [Streptococcus agalactiae]|uniref:carboxymuconolactone decarboxylase family protein n=1 Tax=Streptococcus agalactiae TaxID=1311 RepID=UPI000DFB0D23|nr:carboxymuconolactone decarboxylase family protein [Streptococcus agalactiae]MCC9879190.1 carboxymuconolactone decarboxylase family protein [Streptococcus agalactiae]MCC9883664.1 carboxymuconolactone decarboxylase family protein [Streptococcus agalactiae]MCC9896736.1 carboxymuconolactone decarboxylase family protein [Streptococcus agalactiae]SUN11249.1 4-carboxymuconolactone decarboxylase, putative [Streptococcus agalactiae]
MKEKQTAGRRQLEEFAPEFARYNDDILFGEVWAKEDHLTDKTRSIITISALISAGNLEQLEHHLQFAKQNGVTKEEIADIITHLAFYVGWPKAWSSFNKAKEIWI